MQGRAPSVLGAVSAVNSNTITVTTKAGPVYIIDATSATVIRAGATSSISGGTASTKSGVHHGFIGGFLGGLGGFFHNLF